MIPYHGQMHVQYVLVSMEISSGLEFGKYVHLPRDVEEFGVAFRKLVMLLLMQIPEPSTKFA